MSKLLIKVSVVYVVVINFKLLLLIKTRGQNFERTAKCKHKQCCTMSTSPWCEFNFLETISKLHDMSANIKRNSQEQLTFTPRQLEMKGTGYKSKLKEFFRGTEKAWNKLIKPGVNVAASFMAMAVGSEPKNPNVGQATTNISKNIFGGRVISLTNPHSENVLRFRNMKTMIQR